MTTADRMAVLDRGILQQTGTPAELYDYPVNRFVAGFVGTMNMLEGTVRGRDGAKLLIDADGVGPIELALHADAAAGARVAASFRPHTMLLAAAGDPVPPAAPHAWLEGSVQAREFLGEFTRYRIRTGTQSLVADRAHHAGSRQFAIGSTVRVGIDPGEVRLLAD